MAHAMRMQFSVLRDYQPSLLLYLIFDRIIITIEYQEDSLPDISIGMIP